MSHNPSFYNDFHSNFTFQNAPPLYSLPFPSFPPPPLPPVIPFVTSEISDDEFIRRFENCIPPSKPKFKVNVGNLKRIQADLKVLLSALSDIKNYEEKLSSSYNMSNEEWNSMFDNININKDVIKQSLTKMTESSLEMSIKCVSKRASKRRRQKKLRERRKEERKERIQQMKENSRKIDENLQKIKDTIQKAKQEEDAKIKADIVLKEVLRKKHDAKKSIAKLEALIKLRKARQNTAKGAGQLVSDTGSDTFHENIEKLKSLWAQKLSMYEMEEQEQRATLDKQPEVKDTDRQAHSIVKWRKALFGGKENPQVDFNGDVEKFIAVRAQWDQYIDNGPESTPIPVGWVFPTQT